jgi:hypothetical protein
MGKEGAVRFGMKLSLHKCKSGYEVLSHTMDNQLSHNVTEPILFNSLKHHAGYVAEFIRKFSDTFRPACKMPESSGIKEFCCDFEAEAGKRLREELLIIGKSQMDLYTGRLSPGRIAEEITGYLKSKDLLKKEKYLGGISQTHLSFMEIRLSDSSVWVLLPGKIPGRHVHIHPGRHSPLTMRVRSETLKTAITVLCYCNRFGKDHSDLDVINKARTKLLELSPVKEVNPGRGLGRMIEILTHMPPYGEIK